MSEVIKKVENRMANIVKTVDGVYHYVDSCYTLDYGYETMSFPYSIVADEVIDWGEEMIELYKTYQEMEEQHKIICENLEQYVGMRCGL